ncbi:MAG: zinc ABC transporter substrate-binding protein [Candidatus Sumerlaeia bacterium]|nr:zinc ABC transporter substrate-binding protein [Candidatus Sumerlaeia bacterium]
MIRAVRSIVFLFIGLLTSLLMPAAQAEVPLRVVATNEVLADLVRNVGGDRVVVTCLAPAGTDLHSFEPAPTQVQSMARADLVVVNGLGLEGWLDKVIANSGYTGSVIVASAGIVALDADPHDHDHAHGHDHDLDPHAWLSVANGIRYAENIRDGLIAADPDSAEDYRAWGSLYITQLRVLDSWIQREIGRIPRERRLIVTDHNAFQYFGQAYGIEVLALTGAQRLSEPSARESVDLVATMRARGVQWVFVESTGNEKVLERLASEAGARIGGRLTADGLAAPGEPFSYVRMHQVNVRLLARRWK